MNRDECWDTVDVSTHSDTEAETKMDGDQFVCESFSDKLYVPKRSFRKYMKPWHVALCVAVIIIIIIIIATTASKKGNIANKDKQAAEYVSSGVIISDGYSLVRYDPKDKSTKLILRTDKIIGSFDLYKDTTFWSEPNASKIVSVNNKNGDVAYKNAEVIFDNPRFKVQAMEVDHFTEKLYAIDKTTGTAIVIDMKTKRYGILLTDLKQPHDILLDATKGLMFILQPTESILRLNMDGTSLIELIRYSKYISAMTLDHKNKMIYWINDYNTILRSDYLGLNRAHIFKDQIYIISLTVSVDQLFWLWPSNGVHNATLWSCRIQTNDTTCQSHQIQSIGLANATSVKSLSHRGNFDVSNPCIRHKNICQHMCLLSSEFNAGRSCACHVGWESRSDPRSCQPVKEFLLYVLGSTVRGRILNFQKDTFTEVFFPTTLNTKSLNEKGTVDFDYDPHNDVFYVSDDVHVYEMNLRRPSNQTILLTASSFHYIEDLAFDWLSMNLYYSNCSKFSNNSHFLHAMNVRETKKFKRTVRSFTYGDNFGLKGCPYGTVIDASEGNVFFSAEASFFRSIYRTTLNGTRLKMDSKNIDYVHQYRILAIDHEEKRFYWIHRSGLETRIRNVGFDGTDENYVHVMSVANARTISVYKDWMFLSNDLSIWRGNKTTGKGFQRVIPRSGSDLSEPVSAIKIVDLTLHVPDDKNSCGKNNGGCEQFCYASPKKTCGCVDDRNLRDNGHCY